MINNNKMNNKQYFHKINQGGKRSVDETEVEAETDMEVAESKRGGYRGGYGGGHRGGHGGGHRGGYGKSESRFWMLFFEPVLTAFTNTCMLSYAIKYKKIIFYFHSKPFSLPLTVWAVV